MTLADRGDPAALNPAPAPSSVVSDVHRGTGIPRKTVERTLVELDLLGLLQATEEAWGSGRRGVYRVAKKRTTMALPVMAELHDRLAGNVTTLMEREPARLAGNVTTPLKGASGSRLAGEAPA
jgi:DNA-binding IclR family transcriptional regulator